MSRAAFDQLVADLDPADAQPTPPHELRRLRDAVLARGEMPPASTLSVGVASDRSGHHADRADTRLVRVNRARPLRRRRTVAIGAGALALAATLAIVTGVGLRSPQQAGPAAPDAAAEQVLQRSNPLAVGRSVDCGGQLVPASTLALPGGVERADTPESAALRAFIEANPFAGMGSVSGGNWVRIGTSEDPLVFGQRVGDVGIGAVVGLSRKGNGWEPANLGGCSSLVPAAGEKSAFIHDATLSGRTLRLTWDNGRSGGDGSPLDQLLVRIEMASDAAGFHVLVVTRNNPAVDRGHAARSGVGIDSVSTVELPANVPLPKVVLNDAVFPAGAVPVT